MGSLSRLTWIDLDTKSPLKTFEGGHVGVVTSLTMLQMNKQCYVLSAGDSSEDYTITAWKLSLDEEIKQIKSSEKHKQNIQQSGDSIIAKFSVNECVRNVFVMQPSSVNKISHSATAEEKTEQLIGAITKTGTLHCFKHEFSSMRRKKPIKPKSSIQARIYLFGSNCRSNPGVKSINSPECIYTQTTLKDYNFIFIRF